MLPRRVISAQPQGERQDSLISETRASRAPRPPSFHVCDRDPPAQSASARLRNSPSRYQAAWPTPFQPLQHHLRAKLLFLMNKASRAYRVAVDRHVEAPFWLRGLFRAVAAPFPAGNWPLHSPVAVLSQHEIPLRPSPTAKSPRTLRRVQGGVSGYPAGVAAPPGIPSPLEAFAAIRNSFRQAPGVLERNQDRWRAMCRLTASIANHLRGPDNRASPDRLGAWPTLPAGW